MIFLSAILCCVIISHRFRLLAVWASAEAWISKGTNHLLSHACRNPHRVCCRSDSSSARPRFEVFFGASGTSMTPTLRVGWRSFANCTRVHSSSMRSLDLAKGTFKSTKVKMWTSDSLQLQVAASHVRHKKVYMRRDDALGLVEISTPHHTNIIGQ